MGTQRKFVYMLVHVGRGNEGSNCICSAPFTLSSSLKDFVGKTGEYMLQVRNLTSSSSCLFQDDLN